MRWRIQDGYVKLLIDNFDGQGTRDYTAAIDAAKAPRILRRLNRPSEMTCSLIADDPSFVVPASGARLTLQRNGGAEMFTGYLMSAPEFEYLGWGQRGPAYRYGLTARSDETILDRKRLPDRSPFVNRSAGTALRQLADDLLPASFDAGAVQDVGPVLAYDSDPKQTWSENAGLIALQVRASYRTANGAITFNPAGWSAFSLNESDERFCPGGLSLQKENRFANDLTVLGEIEPQAHVKDYFVGDGRSTRFFLSETPFVKRRQLIVNDEFSGSALDRTRWTAVDPAGAVSVSNGKLLIAGGDGNDGGTVVLFQEQIELGGAMVLQHGDFSFGAPSHGIVGGLYSGAINTANCLAGFLITANGADSLIQPVINGAAAGGSITTSSGHHYVLSTRFYGDENYRKQQVFYSQEHKPGFGGAGISAAVRFVLEAHDIDPGNPASQIAASAVLYDGVLSNVPQYSQYALVNAASMNCGITFARMLKEVDVEVRSARPGEGFRTRLLGSLSDGAECTVTSSGVLDFFSHYVPQLNEAIQVRYRSSGRSAARVQDAASVAALQSGADDGTRGKVVRLKLPAARTSADCENAARVLLDQAAGPAWSGAYKCWSDFLPGGASDIFPGDELDIDAPSQGAQVSATVREVEAKIEDLSGEHAGYAIRFANDLASPAGFEFETGPAGIPASLKTIALTDIGSSYMPDLTRAEIVQATSTSVTADCGTSPVAGGAIEIRWSDSGWGADNDRNLIGRFSTQTISLPRLGEAQSFFMKQYDASSPAKYSRFATVLHIDQPLS
jgi:hypothetical protein